MASIVAVVGLAACSSGSASPGVAKLASGGATTTAAPAGGGAATGAGASGSQGAAASPGGGSKSSGQEVAKLEAYAQCMRSHGVPSFPDPVAGSNGGGGFQIRGGPGLDPNSSTFQAADRACRSLLPNGGVAKQLTPAQQQAFLNWAQCIREHGVPTFPDPSFTGGGVRIAVQGRPGSQAALQAAQRACKPKLPAGFAIG
jgi:hypothetical protein